MQLTCDNYRWKHFKGPNDEAELCTMAVDHVVICGIGNKKTYGQSTAYLRVICSLKSRIQLRAEQNQHLYAFAQKRNAS